MSIESAEAFMSQLQSDEAMQAALATVDLEPIENAVNFASTFGFDVTADELRQQVLIRSNLDEIELTDEELELVAGGPATGNAHSGGS